MKPSDYFQDSSDEEDFPEHERSNNDSLKLALGLGEDMAVVGRGPQAVMDMHGDFDHSGSESEWVNSSDEEHATSMLLGGSAGDGYEEKSSVVQFSYSDATLSRNDLANQPYDWTGVGGDTNNPADFVAPPPGQPQSSSSSSMGAFDNMNYASVAPVPDKSTSWDSAPKNDAAQFYDTQGFDTRKYNPDKPPKYDAKASLLVRVWESLVWVYFLSVHAVRLPDVPFGSNFGGVNLYGIALWGIPVCFMMEELYCNIAVTLLTVHNHNAKLGAAAKDMSALTMVVFLGFWMGLMTIALCRGLVQKRSNSTKSPPLYNLRVVSLLCGTAIPAAIGGYIWQNSLRADYALKSSNMLDFYTWPNPHQPCSVVLAAAPFAWPLILGTMVVAFSMACPKASPRNKV